MQSEIKREQNNDISQQNPDIQVAVIVPAFNEERGIAKVVKDFKNELPNAPIFVFDNNSTDNTAQVAHDAGAKVRRVVLRGKGNVVRRMFADVEADVYIMVDGDATYDAGAAPYLLKKLLRESLDMVIGCRVDNGGGLIYRRGHRLGNRILTGVTLTIFGGEFSDMLSGYRAFSRRYVKSFPALTRGFEIETELTVHALELRMPYGELDVEYSARVDGNESKLSTFNDGMRILKTIIRLYMIERPLKFFSIFGVLLASISVGLAVPIFLDYFKTGLVPRFPTAILSMGLGLSSLLSFVCGLVLDTVTRGRQEVRTLAYLSIPGITQSGK